MRYTVIRKLEDNTLNWNRMTLRDLSKRVGIHYTALSKIKNNKEACSEDTYLKIKKELS